MKIELEREDDGRWIAEVTECEAIARAEALALRVIADRLENGEE